MYLVFERYFLKIECYYIDVEINEKKRIFKLNILRIKG